MNDRELLEAAAKAAGVNVWTDIDGNYYSQGVGRMEEPWNPLTDDGDALRLAVKLSLQIDVLGDHIAAGYGRTSMHSLQRVNECVEQHGSSLYAATRRAIVRAAAAIGGQA